MATSIGNNIQLTGSERRALLAVAFVMLILSSAGVLLLLWQ